MMNWRKILLLGLVLISLGSYVYFYELKHKEAQKKAEEKAKKVFSLEAGQVDEISLKKGDRLITCRKEEGKWRLSAPLQFPAADAEAIGNLLSTLTRLDTERVVDEKSQDLSPYGLKEPQFEVTLKGQDEKKRKVSQTLWVGQANPTNSFLYSQMEGNPQIILVDLSLRHELDKDVYDLRDKTVMAFQPEEIQKVELSLDKLSISVGQASSLSDRQDAGSTSTGRWSLLAPLQYRADGEKVQEILRKVKELKVKEFIVEEAQDLSPYGLTSPTLRLSLWTKPQGEPSQVLLLGTRDLKSGGIYARHRAGRNVFTIGEDFVKILPVSVDDLRDPHPFLLGKGEKVEKLELRVPGETVLCIKDKKDRWQLQSPVQAMADQTEIEALLEKVRTLKVEGFIKDNPTDFKPFGLEQPQRQFRIWQQGQVNPQVLLVGQESTNNPMWNRLLACRMEDQKTVFLLSSSLIEGLFKKADDLRDHAVLSFSTDEIGKLSIRYPSKGFTLEREKNNWKLTEPKKAKAKYTKVLDLLWEVNGLKYLEIATEKGIAGDFYGLDKPRLTLTFWKKNGELLDALLLGAKIPEKNALFAKTKSRGTIYLVEGKFLEKIPKEVAEIADE